MGWPRGQTGSYVSRESEQTPRRVASKDVHMRVSPFVALFCLVPPGGQGPPSEVAPQVIYRTYFGGRHKECATAIAVDG
jgi:hypothetical protein